MIYYAGIGTRSIRNDEAPVIICLAQALRKLGWGCISGHAPGADQAFEHGAGEDSISVLPWPGFEAHISILGERVIPGLDQEIRAATGRFHPTPRELDSAAHALIGRNACQVLGYYDNDQHCPDAEFVVCCADPKAGSFTNHQGEEIPYLVEGGTGQACRVAWGYNVPVFNVRVEGWFQDLRRHLYKYRQTLKLDIPPWATELPSELQD